MVKQRDEFKKNNNTLKCHKNQRLNSRSVKKSHNKFLQDSASCDRRRTNNISLQHDETRNIKNGISSSNYDEVLKKKLAIFNRYVHNLNMQFKEYFQSKNPFSLKNCGDTRTKGVYKKNYNNINELKQRILEVNNCISEVLSGKSCEVYDERRLFNSFLHKREIEANCELDEVHEPSDTSLPKTDIANQKPSYNEKPINESPPKKNLFQKLVESIKGDSNKDQTTYKQNNVPNIPEFVQIDGIVNKVDIIDNDGILYNTLIHSVCDHKGIPYPEFSYLKDNGVFVCRVFFIDRLFFSKFAYEIETAREDVCITIFDHLKTIYDDIDDIVNYEKEAIRLEEDRLSKEVSLDSENDNLEEGEESSEHDEPICSDVEISDESEDYEDSGSHIIEDTKILNKDNSRDCKDPNSKSKERTSSTRKRRSKNGSSRHESKSILRNKNLDLYKLVLDKNNGLAKNDLVRKSKRKHRHSTSETNDERYRDIRAQCKASKDITTHKHSERNLHPEDDYIYDDHNEKEIHAQFKYSPSKNRDKCTDEEDEFYKYKERELKRKEYEKNRSRKSKDRIRPSDEYSETDDYMLNDHNLSYNDSRHNYYYDNNLCMKNSPKHSPQRMFDGPQKIEKCPLSKKHREISRKQSLHRDNARYPKDEEPEFAYDMCKRMKFHINDNDSYTYRRPSRNNYKDSDSESNDQYAVMDDHVYRKGTTPDRRRYKSTSRSEYSDENDNLDYDVEKEEVYMDQRLNAHAISSNYELKKCINRDEKDRISSRDNNKYYEYYSTSNKYNQKDKSRLRSSTERTKGSKYYKI